MEAAFFMIGSIATLIIFLMNPKKKPSHPLLGDQSVPKPPADAETRSRDPEGQLVAELQEKIAKYEEHLKKLRDFGKSRTETYHDNIDAVLLGPISSGKTSLAAKWANPLTYNVTPEASVFWRRFDLSLHQFGVEKKFDPLFDVERSFRRVLRLRLYDYPGESAQIPLAFKRIGELSSKTTIIFMLQVGYSNGIISGVEENAEYFNGVFVEQIQRGLKEIVESVAKVFVVFNKADLLPREWTTSEALERVVVANSHPIHFIKSVFGPLIEYHIISVRNNLGIVDLLGTLGHAAIDGADEHDRFGKRIANLGREYAKRAI